MNKNEYIKTNKATHYYPYTGLMLHGIEYGIDDYAYLSQTIVEWVINGDDFSEKTTTTAHRVKIHYREYNDYIIVNGNRYYMNQFYRLDPRI